MSKQRLLLLGFGNMGRALATALKSADAPVSVWSRSDRRVDAHAAGVEWADDLVAAVATADVIVCCLSTYQASKDLLALEAVASQLSGKVVVQLCTGLPDEVDDLAGWAAERGVRYIDGKIAVVPASIGAETAIIFYAGDPDLFNEVLPQLTPLAGRSEYVGEKISAAAYADFAFLSFFYASTIGVDLNGARLMAATARQVGLNTPLVNFVENCFKEMSKGGFANLDTSALVHLFRRDLSRLPKDKSDS